jgi:hypothetical protein
MQAVDEERANVERTPSAEEKEKGRVAQARRRSRPYARSVPCSASTSTSSFVRVHLPALSCLSFLPARLRLFLRALSACFSLPAPTYPAACAERSAARRNGPRLISFVALNSSRSCPASLLCGNECSLLELRLCTSPSRCSDILSHSADRPAFTPCTIQLSTSAALPHFSLVRCSSSRMCIRVCLSLRHATCRII